MRYLLIYSFMVLLVMACEEQTPTLPIPEDKLAKVLVDVHLAESAIQELPSVLRDSIGQEYYKQVYQIHDITEIQLNESIRIIKKDPMKMESVYAKVTEELERQTEDLR